MIENINLAKKKSSIHTNLYGMQYKHQLGVMQSNLVDGSKLSETIVMLDGALLYFDSEDRFSINCNESVQYIKGLTGLRRPSIVVAIESFGGLYLQDMDGAIFKAHPETSKITDFWINGKSWVRSLSNHLSDEVKNQTGWPLWLETKAVHNWLSPECRIIAENPISMGGHFSVKNMSPRFWMDAYNHYASLHQIIQNLPPGIVAQWPIAKH